MSHRSSKMKTGLTKSRRTSAGLSRNAVDGRVVVDEVGKREVVVQTTPHDGVDAPEVVCQRKPDRLQVHLARTDPETCQTTGNS